MPTFQYEALNETGKAQKGTVEAADSDEAVERIRAQGLFPRSVREQRVKKGAGGGGAKGKPGKSAGGGGSGGGGGRKKKRNLNEITIGGVSQKLLTSFTRQFSTLQDAGLPILRSLEILAEQQKPGPLKNALNDVQEEVAGGTSLSDAMAQNPKAFDRLYTKMIAAGEVGGVLDLILQRLADFMEKAAKLKKRIISAMIYPACVIGVAFVIVAGIMVFIVPKFKKIFEDFDTELPALTKFLMVTSGWMAGTMPGQTIPGVVWLLFVPFIVYFGVKLIRKSKGGKYVVDRIMIMLPIVGPLVSKSAIAKFTRTLGTLINAGVPILDAINITKETTPNDKYQRALAMVYDNVRNGESFAEPLRQTKACDSLVVNMLEVGEETGDLDKMLSKVADNYDEEVDNAVAALTSLIEPLMVIVLGGLVGGIVVALFMPLVKLISNLTG